jgi:hypothetical protein
LNVNFLTRINLCFHRLNGKVLNSRLLKHSEVILDGVDTLVLKRNGKSFRFSHSNSIEVKFLLELTERYLERFSFENNSFVLLFDALLFNIFYFKHDVFVELLLGDSFEGDVNLLDSTGFEWLVRLRALNRYLKFFRKLVASSQTPVNWDSTSVSENEGLHVCLIDKGTLKFNLLLVDSNYGFSS